MAPTSTGCTSFHFSTEELASNRLSAVTEALEHSSISQLNLRPFTDEPFHLDMKGCRLGLAGENAETRPALSVMRIESTMRGKVERTQRDESVDPDIVLHIQEAGQRTVCQLDKEATANPGTGVLATSAYLSTHIIPEPARFVVVSMRLKDLTRFAPSIEDAVVRPLSAQTGILHLLLHYLDILRDADALRTVELQQAFVTHVHDLVALAIGASTEAAEIACGRGLRAARMRAIKAVISQNLGDRALRAEALARYQGVTARYVHKLFAHEGTTLSQYVLCQRLARVHRMLCDWRHDHQMISDIAYLVGFSDLSTFNRAFRRQFAATPSDIRAEARRETKVA